MFVADVVIHIISTLEVLVTSRAIISSLETEMNVLHVSPNMPKELLSTYQANRATVTGLNVVLQQLIQGKGMASIHS